MIIKDIFCKIFGVGNKDLSLALEENRNAGSRAAVIFVHGFSGDVGTTWASFLTNFLNDHRLNDWDVYSAGYPTNLSIDLPIWTSDPDIRVCAVGLTTKLRLAPLDSYQAIVLVAHSMGGLVVQRAILDSEELRNRLRHVLLYGTPSAGVLKASLVARIKRQASDMCAGSTFITQLREDWQNTIGERPLFSFTAIAGETDAFVPASSSIDPFPNSQQAVVPGNHLGIVRPDSTDHYSYELFYKTLTDSRGAFSAVESARLAVEHNEFNHAIELLLPGADGLDADAIVTLALALESVGRNEDAIEVIEKWNDAHERRSLDPIGVLAGRLKRRWMTSRQEQDFDRALELYNEGLECAEASKDHSQAYYHAINVAFLRLLSEAGDGPPTTEVKEMARRALGHVDAAHENHWTCATKGEAHLMLGNLEVAVDAYRGARGLAKDLRQCDSMHMQAVTVALRVFGEDGAKQIDEVFGLS